MPGAPPGSTIPSGINDLGQIVGTYFDSNGPHAFLDAGGKYTTIVVPSSNSSAGAFGSGINDFGQIVGTFVDSTGTVSGFLDTQGHFTTFDVPNAIGTVSSNLNNLDQIVGTYGEPVTFNNIAFLATPNFDPVLAASVRDPAVLSTSVAEPSSLTLAGVGFIALGLVGTVSARRRWGRR